MPLYASVNSVYQLVKRFSGKDEQGFVTIADFNYYIPNAQQELFSQLIAEYSTMLAKRSRYLTHRNGHYNSLENLKDDLRPLAMFEQSLSSLGGNNIFQLPDNYAQYIDVIVSGDSITLVDAPDKSLYSNSFDAAPSLDDPIAVMKQTEIEVLPSTITSGVSLSYYKTPQGVTTSGTKTTSQPTWAYNTVNSQSIYNASNSIDFELPKHLEYRLAAIILGYIGIELREPQLYEMATGEEAAHKQDSNQ